MSAPDIRYLDLRRAIETDPAPLDFVLPGLLAGTVGAIVAPGETGKSFLAIGAAITISTGLDALGLADADKMWKPQSGKVVIFSAEDDDRVLAHRFHAAGQILSPAAREMLYENLRVLPLFGLGFDVEDQDWQRRMGEAIGHDTRLVIVDTLRRSHRREEGNDRDMAIVLDVFERICRSLGTAVIFVHHVNKFSVFNGAGASTQASRGSTVITDNIRWQVNLVAMSETEAENHGIDDADRGRYVRLVFSKVNYSARPAEIWLERQGGGLLDPVVLERSVAAARARKRAVAAAEDALGDGWTSEPIAGGWRS